MEKLLRVNVGKAKLMVSGNIKNFGLSKSKVYLCGVWSLRGKINSFLCEQCGKWINGRYAEI